MKNLRVVFVALMLAVTGFAQAPADQSVDRMVERIVAREQLLVDNIRKFTPLVETYLQNVQPDPELGLVPISDQYFLGRVDVGDAFSETLYTKRKHRLKRAFGFFTMDYAPEGFAGLVLVDGRNFDRAHYDFKYVRREFLGDVRCVVFDVSPKSGFKGGFQGRIWAEDQEFNIVRFNGRHRSGSMFSYAFHFDSWRQNVRPGLWLPTYVYNEESDLKYGMGLRKLRFKSQTRIWGYDPKFAEATDELTTVRVESTTARDQAESARDYSPLESQRAWQAEAEQNLVERLERAGVIAPKGEVEKVLETVANNLMVTNNLDIQPEVQCRVLLTSPLESFAVGHTIVLSRGLIDVLPDEASLAMVVARELAHIVLGNRLDTSYAFSDRTQFEDQETFRKVSMTRDAAEDAVVDAKAVELLKNSPYREKLSNAGLFLRMLAVRGSSLPGLTRARIGNPVMRGSSIMLAGLTSSAPQLQMERTDQVPALPMGARIKVDPWSSTILMMKNKPVALLSARDKMPFEVTPLRPYLRRYQSATAVAGGASLTAAPAATGAAMAIAAPAETE